MLILKSIIIILLIGTLITFIVVGMFFLPDIKSANVIHLINPFEYNSSNETAVGPKPHSLDQILPVVPRPFNPASNQQGRNPVISDGSDPDPEIQRRRNFVKRMTKHAWDNYVKYAWGDNELRPISKKGHSAGIFGNSKLGASIVDGLDTLYIMGLREEFNASRDWISKNFKIEEVDSEMSVFETIIRFVGGFLTCYAFTKDIIFLHKAEAVAERMLPAFNTPTGIPHALINPSNGASKNYAWASQSSAILAEIGTLHLEFTYLSDLLENPVYKNKVINIRRILNSLQKPYKALYPNYISSKTGKFGQQHISIGALGDSFYEYLIKQWVQSGGRDTEARKMYNEAAKAIEDNLVQRSKSGLVYLAEMKYDKLEHKMDHLACFSGGMFAMGAQGLDERRKKHYLELGAQITNTCHESYIRTATRIGPESFRFTDSIEALAVRQNEKYYIQRPEVLESYFYMWRYTHDPKYRDWAWDAALAIEKHCRVENGYSGLKNVYDVSSPKDDVQQSFIFAETFKYLYLIFSNDDLMSLNEWVFNTEAHPLPIKGKNPAYPLKIPQNNFP